VAVGCLASEFYREHHPVAPVPGIDPLVSPYRGRCDEAGRDSAAQLRLAFAALWEPVKERTWSGSAWRLLEALRTMADVADVGVEFDPLMRYALQGIHARYRGGRITSNWTTSRLTGAYRDHTLRRSIRKNFGKSGYDAAITIDSIAEMPEPFFIYYDCSWDSIISAAPDAGEFIRQRAFSAKSFAARRDFQAAMYHKATGVIVESRWMARSLAEQSGVSPAKIYVAPPGIIAGRDAHAVSPVTLPWRERPRRKLLYVGRMHSPWDFLRKGGDLAVAALAVLRGHYDPEITLTIVGMEEWPLPDSVPDGVDFRGVISPGDVAKLYDTHDLFVMPSRMEPFGLAFVEAMSRGMPCVARNAYAMPEIITPGVSGALIDNDDADELAAAIAAVLADDSIYQETRDRAPRMAEYFSWKRTARDVTSIIRQGGSA
jgi:glycosyltransferase involved in cell wall biosynthesis